MWFWFGLEILRLVYEKAFFEILNGFYLIWPFKFQENSIVTYKSWKKLFLQIGQNWSQKKRNFAEISKMCRTLVLRSFQRFFLRRTLFSKNLIFCKFFPLSLNSRLLHISEISAKFCFFWYPLWSILKKFVSHSYKGQCYFFRRIKGQIR